MNYFYSNDINDDIIVLKGDEFKHCLKSLRKRKGDKIYILDGKGTQYSTILEGSTKNECTLKIQSQEQKEARPISLTIGIAPTKNMARFEWFLEKAVEIGIEHIYPILSATAERKNVRIDRLQRIALSAMKQSGSFFLPEVHELISLKEFISKNISQQKFVAHYDEQASSLKTAITTGEDASILIGPEGDFNKGEIDILNEAGYKTVILGHSRLRTETAGVYATTVFNLMNE